MTSSTWASPSDLRDDLVADVGEPRALDALEFASYVLWALSGRIYGPVRTVIEAYDTRQTLASGAKPYPVFLNGRPYNTSACSKCSCVGCGVYHRTRLRGYPVRSILDVWVNGCLLSRHDYALLDMSVLGLMSADVCNAQCMVVRYAYGSGVPAGGKNAVVKLAEQLLEAGRGGECSLPERVTSVSRQGMSWTLLDPQDFLSQGRTGIYEIDLLLSSLNPARALARPRVFSPDLERATVYDYSLPPLSLLMQPGDQVAQPGLPARWATNDLVMLGAVRSGHALLTILDDGTVLSGAWYEMVTHAGGVVLDLTPEEVALLKDGMSYRVVDSGQTVYDGIVRVLEGN